MLQKRPPNPVAALADFKFHGSLRSLADYKIRSRRSLAAFKMGGAPHLRGSGTRLLWAILDSNQGPRPYQRRALTD